MRWETFVCGFNDADYTFIWLSFDWANSYVYSQHVVICYNDMGLAVDSDVVILAGFKEAA